MEPSLRRVVLSRDVLQACLGHALSTEHQEVMGLLLGQVESGEARVERALVLSRRDKQKDRVEVPYEQLAAACTIAEQLSEVEGAPQTVIGWYHSHPHITVMPSHVDVKTQGCMQMLDSNFLGLIFSVFDASGDMNVCAFQSLGEGLNVEECVWSRVEIPITITHMHIYENVLPPQVVENRDEIQLKKYIKQPVNIHKKESLVSVQQTLLSEAKDTFEEALFLANQSTNLSNGSNIYSDIELSRLASIYHLNLLRIVDVQMLPTLHSLQCHRKSLEEEKRKLQRILGNSEDPASPSTTSEQDICARSRNAITILEETQKSWSNSMSALQLAISGCDNVSVSSTTLPIKDEEVNPFVARVQVVCTSHSLLLPCGTSCFDDSSRGQCFNSPWSIKVCSTSAEGSSSVLPLLAVRPGKGEKDVNIIVAYTPPSSICREESSSQLRGDGGSQSCHTVTLTFATDEACLWRENLHGALRLDLLSGRGLLGCGVTDSPSQCVVDISHSQLDESQ